MRGEFQSLELVGAHFGGKKQKQRKGEARWRGLKQAARPAAHRDSEKVASEARRSGKDEPAG